MERRVANTYPGPPPPPQPQPPPQVPYYHNNYNHHYHNPHHQQIHPPPPQPQPPHHHVAAVGFHQFPQNGDQRFMNPQPPPPHFDNNNHYPVVQQQQQPPNNMIGGDHTTPFPPPPNGGGFSSPAGGLRKRRSQSATGLSPDPTIDGGSIKLYIAPVSKTASEDDIRQVFAKYGNVTEIILPKDKMTAERTAYCFVKYKKLDEANAAIAGLTDQYTFPGDIAPVKVRYADAERERIGFPVVQQVPDKLYVRCLNKQTTKAEVHEVFSRFGVIEDIYMALDDMKISRGYAFVQFSLREMALAAINGLNGIFTMRGSDQPLTVRFADPKKPRLGEPPRSNFNTPPPPLPPMQQQFDPNWHPPQQQQQPYPPQWGGNHDFVSQQPIHFPPQQQQLNAQPVVSSSEVHKPMHHHQNQDNPPQNLEKHQKKPETASAEDQNNTMSSDECDWSEHTCPDGNKYYFHCITCESTWEKPEEYSMFEKWFEEQTRLLQDPKLSQRKVENGENNHPVTRLPVETCS